MRPSVCVLQVTQDFLKYIQEQSGGEIPEGKGREPPPYPSEEEEEEEEIPYISAEELVRGCCVGSCTNGKRAPVSNFRIEVLMLMFCVTVYIADWRVRESFVHATEREQ